MLSLKEVNVISFLQDNPYPSFKQIRKFLSETNISGNTYNEIVSAFLSSFLDESAVIHPTMKEKDLSPNQLRNGMKLFSQKLADVFEEFLMDNMPGDEESRDFKQARLNLFKDLGQFFHSRLFNLIYVNMANKDPRTAKLLKLIQERTSHVAMMNYKQIEDFYVGLRKLIDKIHQDLHKEHEL